jgi:hypothetical protein
MSGIITLSFFSAEIEVQKDFDFFPITSSLRKVQRARARFIPAVRWSVTSRFILEPTDQGAAVS